MKYFEEYKPQILALISIFVLGFVVYALPIEAVKNNGRWSGCWLCCI